MKASLKRRLRIYAAIIGALVAFKLVWFALEAESGSALVAPVIAAAPCARLVERLDTLVERLTGADDLGWATGQMDEQFQGEWRIVSLSMTAIGSANLATAGCTTRERALDVTGRLLERALSPEARAFDTAQWGEDALATLDESDARHAHIGYLAHLAMVMSAHRAVGGTRHESERVRIIDALARRITAMPSVYLPTYPGETYAMDNSVVIAAIGVDGRYADVVARFIDHTRTHLLDARTGLVVFALDRTGAPLTMSRGSGAGWNAFWLPFADREFADEQWARLREHFLVSGFGLTAAREFPVGVEGTGDADSGPVLLGLSPAGTGFAVGGAAWARDGYTLGRLLGTAEMAGFTTSWGGRRYLLAPVVGDAILLAMTTSRPW